MKNRTFDTGANRNSDEGKHDIEGFNNPMVDEIFNSYMYKHSKLEDGTIRQGDNWQKGIPHEELLKSLLRHTQAVMLYMRGYETEESIQDSLCGVRFNTSALMLHYVNLPSRTNKRQNPTKRSRK